jgi:hypothetical protein
VGPPSGVWVLADAREGMLTRRGHLSAQGNHTTTGACGGIGLVSTHDPSRASLFYFLLVIYFLLF